MSADFLTLMAESSRERVARARALCPEQRLRQQAQALPRPPPLTLSRHGFDLIAEVKLRSPALGPLSAPATAGRESTQPAGAPAAAQGEAERALTARVRAYAEAGAAAVSVLTEPSRFEGSLAHLEQAARALDGRAPVMRKDFLTDPYQIYEARAAGASGVLLIVRMLEAAALSALIEACVEMQLFALLEVFDESDAASTGALLRRFAARTTLLVGVNCRDLVTLQVVPERLQTLATRLPSGVVRVAESGIESAADAARWARAGYDVALVGAALMRAPNPGELAAALLASGRAAAATRGQDAPWR